jgi:hypothetical protein
MAPETSKPRSFPVLAGTVIALVFVIVLALFFIPVPTQQENGTVSLWESLTNGANPNPNNSDSGSSSNSLGEGMNPTNGNGSEEGGTIGSNGNGSDNSAANGAPGSSGSGASNGAGNGTSGAGATGAGGGNGGGSNTTTGASASASESGTTDSCGDSLCTAAENCLNCAVDCGNCTDTSCTGNNGTCQATCGTGFVDYPEGDSQCQPSQFCCIQPPPGGGAICGNGIIETGEKCECGLNGICGDSDDDLNNRDCIQEGFQGGNLYCDSTCMAYNENECIPFWER